MVEFYMRPIINVAQFFRFFSGGGAFAHFFRRLWTAPKSSLGLCRLCYYASKTTFMIFVDRLISAVSWTDCAV